MIPLRSCAYKGGVGKDHVLRGLPGFRAIRARNVAAYPCAVVPAGGTALERRRAVRSWGGGGRHLVPAASAGGRQRVQPCRAGMNRDDVLKGLDNEHTFAALNQARAGEHFSEALRPACFFVAPRHGLRRPLGLGCRVERVKKWRQTAKARRNRLWVTRRVLPPTECCWVHAGTPTKLSDRKPCGVCAALNVGDDLLLFHGVVLISNCATYQAKNAT
jgi:hypothetical protein